MSIQPTGSSQNAAEDGRQFTLVGHRLRSIMPSKNVPTSDYPFDLSAITSIADPFVHIAEADKMESEEFFGQLTHSYATISGLTAPATLVTAKVNAILLKNIFADRGEWNCYIGNYLSFICSFSLSPSVPPTELSFSKSGASHSTQVLGFAMSVSAAVVGNEKEERKLYIYTTKRSSKSAQRPGKIPMAPESASCSSPLPTKYTFERIRFKNSTKYNSIHTQRQEFFRLRVELWVQIGEEDGKPKYIKLMHRNSGRLIVRTHRPDHPQPDGSHNNYPAPYAFETPLSAYNNTQEPFVGDMVPVSFSMPGEIHQDDGHNDQLGHGTSWVRGQALHPGQHWGWSWS